MTERWSTSLFERLTTHVYRDEVIPQRFSLPKEKLSTSVPKLLCAMRSLVATKRDYWQSRAELFLK